MFNKLGFRAALIGLLWLLLLVPLALVDGVRSERGYRYIEAKNRVAQDWGSAQLVSGVYVYLPPSEAQATAVAARSSTDGNATLDAAAVRLITRPNRGKILLPKVQSAQVTLQSEIRHLGIFSVPVYRATLVLSGSFDAERMQRLRDLATSDYLAPELRLSFSDPRGVRQDASLQVNGESLKLLVGDRAIRDQADMRSVLSATALQQESLRFELSIELAGTNRLALLPFADDFSATVQSDWPHPSFLDGALPESSEIGASGFTATWRSSAFNRGFPDQIEVYRDAQSNALDGATPAASVALYLPADPYQQTERATKYGALFIAMVLGTFLLAELLLKLRLHPLNYALIGSSLALFYLLLLAFAEVLPFIWAYIAAATANVALTGCYSVAVLKLRRRGAAVALMLAGIYAFLYVLIAAEERSLLMGAIGLTAMLATIMYLTRHLNAETP